MVSNCSVRGCKRKRTTHPGLKLYTFPKDKKYREKWIEFCDQKRQKGVAKTATICSAHFEAKYKVESPINKMCGYSPKRSRNLTHNAVPTIDGPRNGWKNNILSEDDDSIAIVDSEVNLESSSSCSEAPRYMCSDEAVVRILGAASEAQTDLASEVVIENEPPPMEKPRMQCSSHERVIFNPQGKTAPTKLPNMRFATDASEYVVIKRSDWKDMQERLQQYIKKEKEIEDIEAMYAASQAENEALKKRLAELAEGTVEGLKLLKTSLAELGNKNTLLTHANLTLRRDLANHEERSKKHAHVLRQYFSTGQLKRLFDDDQKRLRWGTEDIKEALTLRFESISAYRFLQDKFDFLLPDLRTLRRWMREKKEILDGFKIDSTKLPTDQDAAVESLIRLHEETENNIQEP